MKLKVLLMVLVLTLSLFGCAKEQPSADKEIPSSTDNAVTISLDTFTGDGEYDFTDFDKVSEIFVCKITDAEVIGDSSLEFFDYIKTDGTYMMYTAEIEKTYWSLFSEEGTTVKIVRGVSENLDNEFITLGCEVGSRYIMSADVQTLDDEPVLYSDCIMSAKIGEDNKLEPIATVAGMFYNGLGVKTLDELEKHPDMIEFCKKESTFVSEVFFYSEDDENEKTELIEDAEIYDSRSLFDDQQTRTEQEKLEIQRLLKNIREGILADSKIKIDVDFENRRK